jgi:hypothetical protein
MVLHDAPSTAKCVITRLSLHSHSKLMSINVLVSRPWVDSGATSRLQPMEGDHAPILSGPRRPAQIANPLGLRYAASYQPPYGARSAPPPEVRIRVSGVKT